MILFALTLLAMLRPGEAAAAPPARQLQPYVSPNRLYALHKPAEWKVAETVQPDFFRILASSPDGASGVDLAWARGGPERPNVLRFLAAYRQTLSRTHADVTFTNVRVSRDNLRAVAMIAFRRGIEAARGRYYFEAGPRGLAAQGYFAPEGRLGSERSLLLNVMASLAFLKNDPRPAAGGEPAYYRPALVERRAPDGSLSIRVPAEWSFAAAGGKVVTGAREGGPGFIFTSLQGNPMVGNVPVTQGIIASRYLPPPQTLAWLLQAFGHQGVRIDSSWPDPGTTRELAARVGRQCDVQDVSARWTPAGGMPCTGVFKMMNTLPSVTGLWYTIVAGVWAPEKDAPLYMPALEEVASSFSINDAYARAYIRAGLARLRELQRQTAAAIGDLNRAREQNQRDWEERQRRKEFSDSKWDDYRRGRSYWVSELEGGKVYETDRWGTRDTSTGDYYEGGGYKWIHFEGENPRYPESMREVSSYELQQMQGRRP